MKKTLGYGFLALVVLFAVGAAAFTFIEKTLDKESKTFVDAAVPAIVSDWDVAEIKKRASPEFEETVDYEELQQLLDILHGLGELEEYKGSTGGAKMALSLQRGIIITAGYDVNADFEAGSAEIQIALIKHGGQWQILGLTITPQEFNERKDII